MHRTGLSISFFLPESILMNQDTNRIEVLYTQERNQSINTKASFFVIVHDPKRSLLQDLNTRNDAIGVVCVIWGCFRCQHRQQAQKIIVAAHPIERFQARIAFSTL